MSLEPFEISKMPPYLAVSHVWSESLFPVSNLQNNVVERSDGVSMLQTAQEQKTDISHRLYAWIDTWCIDQSDPEDKDRQIPEMANIYKHAKAVVVIVRHMFSFTQADWDAIIENLQEPVELISNVSARYTSASFDLYKSVRYTGYVRNGLRIMLEISNLPWMKRVWTAQEYALAVAVVFIGQDLRAFQCSPYDMNNLLILNQISISESRIQCESFSTLNNIRIRWIDLTLIMDLAKDRNASCEVDEIYGLMGASEVIIPPLQHLTVEEMWRLWLEKAIEAGHLLWIMLPLYNWREGDDCLLTSFRDRHLSVSVSQVHYTPPLGPVRICEETISVTGYFAGNCEIITYLGDIEGSRLLSTSEFTNKVKGDLDLIRQICAAITSGNNSTADTERRAHWSRQYYLWRNAGNVPQKSDLIYTQMLDKFGDDAVVTLNWLPKGKYYLALTKNTLKSTPILLRADRSIPNAHLVAIDVNATLGPEEGTEKHVLMILGVLEGEQRQGRTLHRVGITSTVFMPNDNSLERAQGLNGHVIDSPLETFTISRKSYLPGSESL